MAEGERDAAQTRPSYTHVAWQPVQGSYTWDDSDGVISVHIPIGNIDKKDVEVKITSTWEKAGPKKKEPIIAGKLFQGKSGGRVLCSSFAARFDSRMVLSCPDVHPT